MNEEKQKKLNLGKVFLFGILLIALISTIVVCGSTIFLFFKENAKEKLICQILISIFSLGFILLGFLERKRGMSITLFTAITLIFYNIISILFQWNIVTLPTNLLPSFTNKNLIDVIEWTKKHDIELEETYEYSDMIEEYRIINQNIKENTSLQNIKKLKVAISEGPNPEKEVIIPNMLTWRIDTVIDFIKENYLSNVEVEFISSEKHQDTVIEQEGSGNRRRSDLLKLTFSLGDSPLDPVKMIDLTKMSKIEAIIWLKQHAIASEITTDFSNTIKKENIIAQDKKIGTKLVPHEDKVTLTISKGPKIVVPDLKKMSISEITKWIIKNHLKIKFEEKYHDTIKENKVISANYKKGTIIAQKTLVIITVSKGKLKMPNFDTIDDLKKWANTYQIPYKEEYEFSTEIERGKIIRTSHKKGQTIKEGDTITIVISEGKKKEVPNLIGLKKQVIITKLKDLNLNYNFIYEYDDDVEENIAIKQSMKEGSEVAENTTITVTLSKGKRPKTSKNPPSSQNPKEDNSYTEKPNTSCQSQTWTITGELNNILDAGGSFEKVSQAFYNFFSTNYPGVLLSIIPVTDTEATSGSYIARPDAIKPGSQITSCNGVTYKIYLAK